MPGSLMPDGMCAAGQGSQSSVRIWTHVLTQY